MQLFVISDSFHRISEISQSLGQVTGDLCHSGSFELSCELSLGGLCAMIEQSGLVVLDCRFGLACEAAWQAGIAYAYGVPLVLLLPAGKLSLPVDVLRTAVCGVDSLPDLLTVCKRLTRAAEVSMERYAETAAELHVGYLERNSG